MTAAHQDLRLALFKWRDAKALEMFPEAMVREFGSDLFLSNDLVGRIVNCAHAGKLSTCEDLYKETKWRRDWVDEFGTSLLVVVGTFSSLQPGSTSVSSTAEALPSTSATRQQRNCGACGKPGHNSKHRSLMSVGSNLIASTRRENMPFPSERVRKHSMRSTNAFQ